MILEHRFQDWKEFEHLASRVSLCYLEKFHIQRTGIVEMHVEMQIPQNLTVRVEKPGILAQNRYTAV